MTDTETQCHYCGTDLPYHPDEVPTCGHCERELATLPEAERRRRYEINLDRETL